jgi:hypothetical protein
MAVDFTDVERLMLERWSDVTGLMEAHRALQDRLEEQLQIVADRIGRWARPLGFEVDCSPREAEINAWRPSWADRRKDPRVYLTLGGICPIGFRKVDVAQPYLWVYTSHLADYRIKEPERVAFAHSLRAALGASAKEWEAHDVDDLDGPLGRYVTGYDSSQRAKLLLDGDALFTFCTEQFPILFAIGDTIDVELQKIAR